jgi:hypothetical protein
VSNPCTRLNANVVPGAGIDVTSNPTTHSAQPADYLHTQRADAPANRTHDAFVANAIANLNHRGYKKDQPYKTTGVKELSPLAYLPFFNLIWDIMPDWMHILPGIWDRHIFSMFHGRRTPAPVKHLKKNTALENRGLMRDHEAVKKHLKEWTLPEVREYFDFMSTFCK